MNDQDRILQFLRTAGPSLPGKVAKVINSEILLASAHLSDLSSQGKVKISGLKVGGSPLYYLPGQEAQLYPFAAGNINPKDQQVLEKLKEEKVLRESTQELLAKVALRSLKDFAIPLHVTLNDKTELFWKWHLSSAQDTNQKIAQILADTITIPPLPSASSSSLDVEVPLPLAQSISSSPSTLSSTLEPTAAAMPPVQFILPSSVPSAQSLQRKREETQKEQQKEEQQKLVPAVPVRLDEAEEKAAVTLIQQQSLHADALEPELLHSNFPHSDFPHSNVLSSDSAPEQKKSLLQKVKDTIIRKKVIHDEFMPQLEKFFTHLKIDIEQKDILRKNAEVNLLVKIPSVVGKMRYYCKAKNKSKCDEKDLSTAYMEAQMKKMPLLFLYTDELNKKAQEMLESGAFENAIVKKVA